MLRRFRPEDAATLRRWHADPRYGRHLGGSTDDPAVTDELLARWRAHWEEHGFGLVAAQDRASGALVARGGPQFHRVWPHDPEVGWGVDPAWWGRGIATELGAACVDWAFGALGFRRLVSITTEANVASRRVIEKLGFTLLTRAPDPRDRDELWVYSREAQLD